MTTSVGPRTAKRARNPEEGTGVEELMTAAECAKMACRYGHSMTRYARGGFRTGKSDAPCGVPGRNSPMARRADACNR